MNLAATAPDLLTHFGRGNPGALAAMVELFKRFPTTDPFFLHLDDMNLRGPLLAAAFKHVERDCEKLKDLATARSPELVAAVNSMAGGDDGGLYAVASGASRQERSDYSPHRGMKVVVDLSNEDYGECVLQGREAYARELLLTGKIVVSRDSVREAVERISRLDPSFGAKGHGFNGAVAAAREYLSPDDATAIEVVLDAYKRNKKYKNPAMIRSFSDEKCHNPFDTLKAALRHLNERFDRSVTAVGTIVGSKNVRWDVIEGDFFRVKRGEWVRKPAPPDANFDEAVCVESRLRIGERVTFSSTGRRGTIIKASHRHNGLGSGTSRIGVRWDGEKKITKTVPWLLKEVE